VIGLLDIFIASLAVIGCLLCGLLMSLLILRWRSFDVVNSWVLEYRYEIGAMYASGSTLFAAMSTSFRLEALVVATTAQLVGLAAPFTIVPAHPWYHSERIRHALIAVAFGLAAIVWTIHFVR